LGRTKSRKNKIIMSFKSLSIKVAIGCDHAGFKLKEKLIIKYDNYDFLDLGCFSEESVDYPDFGYAVGLAVKENKANFGIVICGSGIGISIAANKIKNIRAALCSTSEHAKLSRLHNDANVLGLGARLTKEEDIYNIVDTFFDTDFEGDRHLNRVKKIDNIN